MLSGLRRILPHQIKINYVEYDKLSKIFMSIYKDGTAKDLIDNYHYEYEEYKLLPTIKFQNIIQEKELLKIYFRKIPTESEMKKFVYHLHNHKLNIDDDDDFWFLDNKIVTNHQENFIKLVTPVIELLKKVII